MHWLHGETQLDFSGFKNCAFAEAGNFADKNYGYPSEWFELFFIQCMHDAISLQATTCHIVTG